MSTVVAMLKDRNEIIQNIFSTPMSVDQQTANVPEIKEERYLESSTIYQLRGGVEAEVINNPKFKFAQAGIEEHAKEELGNILIRSFGYNADQNGMFLDGNRFNRVAIDVDWLVVVRKKSQPIAFGAGTFITPFLFYVNSAMVLPEYQPLGIGSIAIALLLKIAREYALDINKYEPDIVCRTHNRSAASALLPALVDSKISSEIDKTTYSQMIFERTANHLKCSYDKTTGISKDVYPCELPTNEKVSNKRIIEAFRHLESRDACYVTGKLNVRFINRLLSKTVNESLRTMERIPERSFWENATISNLCYGKV
ncbi:MAG: GNAT family N-acetyltransferase [candidate division FCPU426 bacterium]